jgi:hypothetical protein
MAEWLGEEELPMLDFDGVPHDFDEEDFELVSDSSQGVLDSE